MRFEALSPEGKLAKISAQIKSPYCSIPAAWVEWLLGELDARERKIAKLETEMEDANYERCISEDR